MSIGGVAGALFRGEQNVDFPRLWRWALMGSLAAVVLSLASFALRGVDLGIEFNGGTAWEAPAQGLSVASTRDALRSTGAADAKIQTIGGDSIRVRADTDSASEADAVRLALAEAAGVDASEVSVTTVGPSWGSEITKKARNALLAFFALVAAYIAIRLEWKMAAGALAAVAHDIVISVGFYSIFQFEITSATVIAFLTIMGYSLYDTIVVYDKVREVVGRVSGTGRYTYTEMMNLSLNQVLMRSVNTSITSMLPVASMLVIGSFVLGAVTLQEFAVALLVGIVVGTYSSLFVAAALVAWMKEREPDHAKVADKIRRRSGGGEAGAGGTRTVAAADAILGDIAGPRGGGLSRLPRLPARHGRPGRSGAQADPPVGGGASGAERPRQPAGGAEASKPKPSYAAPDSSPGPASKPAIPPRPRKKKRKRR